MAGGRPLKWTKKEEIEPLIDEYFKECDRDKRPYTVSGLAYAMDTSRETLMRYQGKGEFYDTIKKAKDRCEFYAEEKLHGGGSVAGVIFSMKNNYDWRDKSELDMTAKHSVNDMTDDELKNYINSLVNNLEKE